MIWWWMSVALAASPEGVDLDDISRWREGIAALGDGPAGCWDMRGDVAVRVAFLAAPDRFSSLGVREFAVAGPFTGRLSDGVWKDLEADFALVDPPKDVEPGEIDLPVVPLVGRSVQESEDGEGFTLSVDASDGNMDVAADAYGSQAMSLLRSAIEDWGSNVSTSYARWNEERGGVEWVEFVPIHADEKRSPEVEVTAFFPGGAPLPLELDAVWPRTIKIRPDGSIFRVTIKDAQMHVRSEVAAELLFPVVESASLILGFMGFTIGYEQKLTYRQASPCVD